MKKIPQTGVCPNCHLASSFSESHRVTVWPAYESGHYSGSRSTPVPTLREVLVVMTCRHCSKTATYLEQQVRVRSSVSEAPGKIETHVRLIHPARAPRELSEHVPDAIRSLFQEASICEHNGALRGAAGLYRAAVEKLCDAQTIAPGTLYKRLEAMKASVVDDQIVDDLHEARMLGNDSLHDGTIFSAEEVADVAELIIEATTALYVQPAERRRLRDARRNRSRQQP